MILSRDYTKRIPSADLDNINGGELAKIIVEALHHEAIPGRMNVIVQLILEDAFKLPKIFTIDPDFVCQECGIDVKEIIKRG